MMNDVFGDAHSLGLRRRLGVLFMLGTGLALSSAVGCADAAGLDEEGAGSEQVLPSDSTLPAGASASDVEAGGAEELAQVQSALVPVAVVQLANDNEYRFMGMADELGEITEIGVMELGRAGSPSLQYVDAGELNPLELFLGLTGVERQVPEALSKLHQAGPARPRGWIADAIEGARVSKALNGCSDSQFLSRFGDLQSGYDHHAGPEQGCWLNSGWYNFVWQVSATKVHLGLCVQAANDYTHVVYRHRAAGSDSWHEVYANSYVPQGWFLHWFWESPSARIHRLQIDPHNVAGTYDIGFDYND